MKEHLLRNPASQDPEVRPRIASGKIIAPSNLEVGLFYKSWPQQAGMVSIDYIKSTSSIR